MNCCSYTPFAKILSLTTNVKGRFLRPLAGRNVGETAAAGDGEVGEALDDGGLGWLLGLAEAVLGEPRLGRQLEGEGRGGWEVRKCGGEVGR